MLRIHYEAAVNELRGFVSEHKLTTAELQDIWERDFADATSLARVLPEIQTRPSSLIADDDSSSDAVRSKGKEKIVVMG